MSKYSNGVYSIGDPVEISSFEIKNMRGDYRVSWRPAVVVGFQPEVVVAFSDSSRLVVQHGSQIRTPRWFLDRFRKVG